MCHINYCIFADKKSCLTSKRMLFAEFSTIAKSLPQLRWNTHKSLILSYSEYLGRIFKKKLAIPNKSRTFALTRTRQASSQCLNRRVVLFYYGTSYKTGEDGKQHILARFDWKKRPNNRKIEFELKIIAFLLYIFYVWTVL